MTGADGYALLQVASPHAINVTLYEKNTVKVTRDIVPVASINKDSFVLLVNPSFPAKTVPEFLAYPRHIPARSIWLRPDPETLLIFAVSCSGWRPASRWFTRLIEARRRRSRRCWPATWTRCSTPLARRCRISNRARCARLE